MNKKFYRNINKRYGKYVLRKGNEVFMTCNTLTEALYERDRFEECGWEWDAYVELPFNDNKYEHMDLPVFTKNPSYISKKGKYYRVQKRLGDKIKTYGHYKTYEEAEERVNRLIENNWEN